MYPIVANSPVSLIIELVILGIIFYFVEQLPLAAPFPALVKVVAVIVAILILLQFFGIAL